MPGAGFNFGRAAALLQLDRSRAANISVVS